MADNRDLKLMVKIYEDILNHLDVGIILSDEENRLLFVNKASERIDGISQKACAGRKMEEIYMVSPDSENKNLHSVVLETGIAPNEYYSEYIVKESHKSIQALEKIYPFKQEGDTRAVYSIIKNLPMLDESLEENNQLKRFLGDSRMDNGTQYRLESIIGSNILMVEAIAAAGRIAHNDSTVLIYGETGTGKELFAQGIHNASAYQNGPFISINCAAIPTNLLESIFFGTVPGAFTGAGNVKGLFEQAQKGTLFLDEINSMDIGLQAKLLKAIETKRIRRLGGDRDVEIQCRIVCALNEDPLLCVEKKKLRSDLYYRLSTAVLTVPPLRHRKDDIPVLCAYFLLKFNHRYHLNIEKVEPGLLTAFTQYDWPGNVRELEHMVESVYTMADRQEKVLSLEDIPPYYKKLLRERKNDQPEDIRESGDRTLKGQMEFYERSIIANELQRQNYNVTGAARVLGLSRQALQYKVSKYRLNHRTEK